MSEPRRLATIRRLFLVKLNELPHDMPEDMKEEAAKAELDKALGPMWRDEIGDAGFGMDPIGCMEERVDNLPMATQEAGFSGEDVPPPVEKKRPEDEDDGESMSKDEIISKLVSMIHG